MSVFSKFIRKAIDYPTGTYEANKRESIAYGDIEQVIRNIEDLLNCYVTEDTLQEYPEAYQRVLDQLNIYKTAIDVCYKQMKKMTNSLDIRDKQLEIKRLEQKYNRALVPVKNSLLASSNITELNNEVSELITIINGNARCTPFKGFVHKKVWTVEDLEALKEVVSLRNADIIDYNGKMR